MKSHEQKITEAAARNRVYKAKTRGEKILSAQYRRGESKKELARLNLVLEPGTHSHHPDATATECDLEK